jgi:hypothetical protein
MKRLMNLAAALLLSGLLAMPALAAGNGANNQPSADPRAPQATKGKKDIVPESQGRRLHKAYFQKREAMKGRREAGQELRQSNIMGNNPGHTGM